MFNQNQFNDNKNDNKKYIPVKYRKDRKEYDKLVEQLSTLPSNSRYHHNPFVKAILKGDI